MKYIKFIEELDDIKYTMNLEHMGEHYELASFAKHAIPQLISMCEQLLCAAQNLSEEVESLKQRR